MTDPKHLKLTVCNCFNCNISVELDEFSQLLETSGTYTEETGQLLSRVSQIAVSENVSNKQRIKATRVLERHSETLKTIMDTLKACESNYDVAVLNKSAEFVEYWTGRKAMSAFK